jgi:hypothetical protein
VHRIDIVLDPDDTAGATILRERKFHFHPPP